jgi:hypothetical protein
MDERLDNDLRNRISEVFENYEDTTADEGWLLLREKFPEERRRRVPAWLWWGSAAAILVLFLTIGLWLKNTGHHPEKLAEKVSKHSPAEKIAAKVPDTVKKITIKNNLSKETSAGTLAKNSTTVKHGVAIKAVNTVPSPKQNLRNETIIEKDVPVIGNTILIAVAPKKVTDSNKVVPNKAPVEQLAAISKPGKAVINTDSIIAAGITKQKPALKSMTELLAEEPVLKNQKRTEKIAKDRRKVHFGVYAGTYFNYGKGSGNNVNVGAGVSSDISISKNLKFSTGLAIAQNTLNYNNNTIPTAAASNDFLKTAYHSPGLAASSAFSIASIAPTLTNYNASLIGLDIPLNLKYEFNPQKNDTYISAGLSSGTFINESYTYHYKYSQFTPLAQQTQDATTSKAFNSFYFAKTLNLAFGVGYPIGKTNRLIIEPFLKYPLDGLGAQQLRFGAGGVNLKFNFKSSKK